MNSAVTPVQDPQMQAVLDDAYACWRRRQFGVAALGCALVLTACGGDSTIDQAAPEDAPAHPKSAPPRPDCDTRPEVCQ